jgi:hypothetical protein
MASPALCHGDSPPAILSRRCSRGRGREAAPAGRRRRALEQLTADSCYADLNDTRRVRVIDRLVCERATRSLRRDLVSW